MCVQNSAKKVGARIKELERLYGIEHGNNRFKTPNNSESSTKTQEELAAMMGISVDTLHNYKKLTEMIHELEDLVDTAIVTKTSQTKFVGLVSSYHNHYFRRNSSTIREHNKRRNSSAVRMCCQTGNS